MSIELIANSLRARTIFKDETVLDVNYVPKNIQFRDSEIRFISSIFSGLLQKPFQFSANLLILGDVGIGKTVTTKFFGSALSEMGCNYGIDIRVVYINCRIQFTSYNICQTILSELLGNFPKRGYSTADLFRFIQKILSDREVYLFLILDEIHILIRKNPEVLYLLTRFTEASNSSRRFISVVGITRDLIEFDKLEKSIASTFQKTVLYFKKYTPDQILKILHDRAQLAFKKGTISEDQILMVSRLVESSSDIRFALNLLWKAGKIAEMEESPKIKDSFIRKANDDVFEGFDEEKLSSLNRNQQIILLSVIKAIETMKKGQVSFKSIIPFYESLCQEFQYPVLSHSQFSEYIADLEIYGFLNKSIKNNGIRGRKALVGIDNIPLALLKSKISAFLSREPKLQ